MQQPLAYIPSPSHGAVHIGPLPLRGYALMIILGVIVAVWLGERRWIARGGASGTVVDIAVWAVPFGLVGGRLYHVITDYQLYFGKNWNPVGAFEVWNGGLGIWGAIACGALGAYLGCRRRGVSLRAFADATAPGIALAQAIGRWGNWFNQELYGRPSKLPWAVKIDPAHRTTYPDVATYQPTFLYESLWCIGVALLVIWAERRFRLAYGRTFAVYVAAYTVGRAWIEWLRVDPAHHILGLRLNDWTSLIVFLCAVAYLYVYRARTENPAGAFGPDAIVVGPDTEPDTEDETLAETAETAETAEETETVEKAEPDATETDESEESGESDESAESDDGDEGAADEDSADEHAGDAADEGAEDAEEPAETPAGPEANGTADEAADEPEDAEKDAEAHETGDEAEAETEDAGKEKATTGVEPGEGGA